MVQAKQLDIILNPIFQKDFDENLDDFLRTTHSILNKNRRLINAFKKKQILD